MISTLANEFDLPVVVYAHESHPMMVRAVLEAGAEDFVSPSTPIEEIRARLDAVVRVRFHDTDRDDRQPTYRLDTIARSVSLPDGTNVQLTLSEYHLFKTLLAAANQPVARSCLVAMLAPFSRSPSSGLLEVTIARLRRKMGAARLRTIRGVGYQLVNGG